MFDERRFCNLADGLSGGQHFTGLNTRFELPAFFQIERWHFFAAPDPRAAVRLNSRQRSLDAVINVADESRAEPHGQRLAGAADGRAGLQHRGVLVNLNGCAVADEPDNFADEAEFADLHDFIHLRAGHATGCHGRAVDARLHRAGWICAIHAAPPVGSFFSTSEVRAAICRRNSGQSRSNRASSRLSQIRIPSASCTITPPPVIAGSADTVRFKGERLVRWRISSASLSPNAA